MTRETKIGLLVGLAFIIVIGILLSDHLTSSTEPPPATLANAGNSVRETVTTPSGNNTPPITNPSAQTVAPQQTVLTPNELQPRPQPVQIVQVGGPNASSPQPVTIAPPNDPNAQPANAQDPTAMQQTSGNDSPIITQVPTNVPGSLAQVAQQHGEGFVALDSSGRPVQTASWSNAPAGAKEYKAEAGDTVSRMAMKFLGGNTKPNRDAIIRANPSLQQDPNRVIVGKTYVIPSSADAASGGPVAQTVPQLSPPPQNIAAASASEYWYTVKENDSLWKIANDQLGKPGAVAAIKELNKDVLNGGDTLHIGMKLRLPGKPLAKAN